MNKKINIIEKDPSICSFIHNTLGKETYNIKSFLYNTKQDLDKILDNKPDLILANRSFENIIIPKTIEQNNYTEIIFIEHKINKQTKLKNNYQNIKIPLKKEELIYKIKTTLLINEIKKNANENNNYLKNELEEYKTKNIDLNIYQKYLEDTISQLTIHLTEANNQLQLEHKIINQVNEALILIDIDGYIESWNIGAEKLFEYKKEEIISKHLETLFTNTNKKAIHNKIINPTLAKGTYKIDANLKTKTNKELQGHLSLSIFKEKDIITKIIIYFLDTSKKKQIEKSLKRSELNLSLLSKLSKDAIISINHNGNILFWNGSAEDIFKYKKDEIINSSIEKLIPPNSKKIYLQRLKQILKSNESYLIGKNIQAQGMRKNGNTFPIELAFCSYNIGNNKFFTAIVRELNTTNNNSNIFSIFSKFAPNIKEDNPFPISEIQFNDEKIIKEKLNTLTTYLNKLGMFFTFSYNHKHKENYKINFISNKLLQKLGYEKKDLKTINDILSKKNKLTSINTKLFNTQSKITLSTKDKKDKNFLCKLKPIYNTNKELTEILITLEKHKNNDYYKEHYKKQKELIHTKEQLISFIWESAQNPIFAINHRNFTIKRLNTSAEKLLEQYPSIIHGKQHELTQIKQIKKPISITQKLYNNKGNNKNYKINIKPILNKEDNIHSIALSVIEQNTSKSRKKQYSENSIIQEKYNAILSSITSQIFITDKNGVIIESNTNNTPNSNQIIGQNILSIQNNKKINLKIKTLLQQNKPFKIYEEPITKLPLHKTKAYVNITGLSLNENNQKKLGAMLIYEDITHSKIIEKLTEASREKYQNIINTIHETIITINDKEEILFSNHQINNLLGYKISDIIGKKLSRFIQLKNHNIKTLAQNNKKSIELIGTKKNKKKIPLELSFKQFKDHKENKYTILIRNISENKTREKELNNYQNKLEKLANKQTNKINTLKEKIKTLNKELKTLQKKQITKK